MQERVRLDAGIPVAFVVGQHLDVGSEDSRSGHRLGGHEQVLLVVVTEGDPQHKKQYDDKRRVNPLDSSVVEVEVGELVLQILLDQNLRDEVPRNHKKHIYANKTACELFRPGVEDDHDADSDGPKSVDIRAVFSGWR